MDNKSKKADGTYQKGQLVGHYQIVAPLVQTQFVRRYLGQQLHHRIPVVIEAPRPPLIDKLRENLLTQARALMKLAHPHILHLWDAGVENYYPFLVMDHESYLTFRQVYPRSTRLSLTRLLPHLKQLASALDYAHSQQILHGDIRPENILLDKHNNILLWGFTIEAIIQNRERLDYQRAEMIHELIAYTAPERLQGKANPASDQYSVALFVYELLCREPPFTGSHIEIAHQQLHTPPPSLQQKIPGIPISIEKVVMKALAKDPSQRFTTIQEFISTLEQEQNARARIATGYSAPPAQPTGVIAAPLMLQLAQRSVLSSNPPPPTSIAVPAPLSPPVSLALEDPITPMHLSLPITLTQATEDSVPLPRRRDNDTLTRRAFAVGLVGLATLGGTGGWYLLQKRLARPAAPTIALDAVAPPATPTSVNQKSALIFTGHLAAVNALAWSPHGSFIASAGADQTVQISNGDDGTPRPPFFTDHQSRTHVNPVRSVAWSPDGNLIASGDTDGNVYVWKTAGRKTIFIYRGHKGAVNALAWSPDGKTIASASSDSTVHVWQPS